MTKIIVTAIIEGISTRQDGTFKVVLGTQEIDRSKVADLFSLVNKFSKVLVTDNNVINELDEALVDGIKLQAQKKTKSKSQQLRNRIWRYWEFLGGHGDFDSFYDNEMNKLLDSYSDMIQE